MKYTKIINASFHTRNFWSHAWFSSVCMRAQRIKCFIIMFPSYSLYRVHMWGLRNTCHDDRSWEMIIFFLKIVYFNRSMMKNWARVFDWKLESLQTRYSWPQVRRPEKQKNGHHHYATAIFIWFNFFHWSYFLFTRQMYVSLRKVIACLSGEEKKKRVTFHVESLNQQKQKPHRLTTKWFASTQNQCPFIFSFIIHKIQWEWTMEKRDGIFYSSCCPVAFRRTERQILL